MYESFYRFNGSPFRLSPDPAFLYFSGQHREALAALTYAALTHAGLTVLLGEVGTGKTTMLYSLVDILRRQRFRVALITNPKLTSEEFYDFLLLDLGVTCESPLKSRRLAALRETLIESWRVGRRVVLIVDEGQCLSPEVLEEIRLLGNLETPTEKLLDIVIAGQPELASTLSGYDLRSVKQRVSRICRLTALDAGEVRSYIDHRLKQVGLPETDDLRPGGVPVIFEYSSGIPRVVNNLCDSALQIGFAQRAAVIDEEILREVALDLELAGPQREWNDPPTVSFRSR